MNITPFHALGKIRSVITPFTAAPLGKGLAVGSIATAIIFCSLKTQAYFNPSSKHSNKGSSSKPSPDWKQAATWGVMVTTLVALRYHLTSPEPLGPPRAKNYFLSWKDSPTK